jgi:hypothetical protein
VCRSGRKLPMSSIFGAAKFYPACADSTRKPRGRTSFAKLRLNSREIVIKVFVFDRLYIFGAAPIP